MADQQFPIERAASLKQKPKSNDLGFGRHFTDHMFLADYSTEKGWHSARIEPVAPLSLHPGASVLHYGQALFEGAKAFRRSSGEIVLFRPDFHCRRMVSGAERLCMPAPPESLIFEGMKALVRVERDWVPLERGCALYVRPTLIGTEPFLGVRPAEMYLFFIILSPVGTYYSEGLSPIRIWVEQDHVRAAPGGMGAIKASANYAASLYAAVQAKKKGYAQVLWLDAVERKYLEEVGTMNVFLRFGNEIVTPPLGGTILGGSTRDSVIRLLKDWGMTVTERRVHVDEVLGAHQRGELNEVFGTGTAAVITPVGELAFGSRTVKINDFKIGEISRRLYQELTGIQYGERPDPYEWTVSV